MPGQRGELGFTRSRLVPGPVFLTLHRAASDLDCQILALSTPGLGRREGPRGAENACRVHLGWKLEQKVCEEPGLRLKPA